MADTQAATKHSSLDEGENENVETREINSGSQAKNHKADLSVPLQQRTMTPYERRTYLNQPSYPVQSVKPAKQTPSLRDVVAVQGTESPDGGKFQETGAVNKDVSKKHTGAVANKLVEKAEKPPQLTMPVQNKVSAVSQPLEFSHFNAPVKKKVSDVFQPLEFNQFNACNLSPPLMDIDLTEFDQFRAPFPSTACDLSQELNKVENLAQNSKKQSEKNKTPLEEKSSVNEQLQAESANIDGKKRARSRNRRKNKDKQFNTEINQNESLDKLNSDNLKPGVATSSVLNKDHPRTRENFGGRKLYEPKVIIVSGLANTTTKDGLWNYMELMSGEGVENMEFLEKGKAVVHLSRDPDFRKLNNKIRGHKLDGMQPKVERLCVCKRILVSGLPPEVTKDTIKLYFRNVRRSNGGNVVDVTLLKDIHSAVVTFQKSEVVSKVIAKSHSLENKELTVNKYYPQTDAQLTTKRCGTSNDNGDDKRKANDNTPMPMKSKVHEKRLKTSVEVDPDIMEFIMVGNHLKELEDKLNNLNAEIEWNNGSNTATIWKKADSGYVKKWPKRCQYVLAEFLDRFEKVFFLLDEALTISVNEALPRLTEIISPEKALRKQVDQKLVVVCLEEESENVTQSVNEFLEIIKKEEVRKTYKKETIKNVSHNHLLLLKHIKYAEKMKDEHAELEAILDVEKHEIYLAGPRDQFEGAKIKYLHTKDGISEQTLVLPSYITNIIASESGKKRIQENMTQGDISAIVLPIEGDSVLTVVAENFREYERARDSICASMREAKISFPPQHNFIFKKEEWTQISGELNSRELIKYSINYTERLIVLHGVSEIVLESEKKIKEYIKSQRIKQLQRPVSQTVARFFKQNLLREVEGLTARLKDSQVSVEIKETDGVILYRGTETGLQECKRFLDELCRSISEKEKEFSSPGINQLLFGETGQRYIKSIEVEKRVAIETRREQKVNVKETSRVEVESLREELEREKKRELLATETRRKSASVTKSAAPALPGSTYDLCNFSTGEGIRVSWKYGSIADETADILVNSAHSDLSNPTACGRALNKVGGPSYVQACADYTGSTTHAGAVACTIGGNLACSFVLHAVCCRWDNQQGKAETMLRNLVKEILRESSRRGARSLAMPAIGTGLHMFPEDVVFRILREEFLYFSASQASLTLKDIRIIVFAKGPIAKQAPSSISQTPRSISQSHKHLVPSHKHLDSISQTPPYTSQTPLYTSQTPSSISQTPPYTSQTPLYTSQTPPYTSQTPLYTSQTPSSISQTPPYTSQTPPYTSQTPLYTSQTPLYTSQTPRSISQTPPYTSQTPRSISQTPPYTSQTPRSISQTPLYTSQTPSSISQTPPYTSQTPLYTSQTPRSISQTPPYTSQTPRSISQTPPYTSQTPRSISQTPLYTSQTPPYTSQTPLYTSQTPSSISQTPLYISQAPLRSSVFSPTSTQSPASTSSRVVSYGPVRVSLVEGDITEQPVNAIINVLPEDLQLSNGGGVCKSILRKGGQTIQEQLNSCSGRSSGGVVQTTAGSIENARTILHFVPHSKDIADLKASILACLKEAKSLSLSSVAVSAIGTGPFGISAKDSAKMILGAAEKFSTHNYALNMKIVVFQKQIVYEFESVMQKKSPTKNDVAAPLKPILRASSRYSSTQAQSSSSSSQSYRASHFIPLNTGETKQTVKLQFVGRSVQQIDSSIDEVNKFVNDHTKTKEIEHEKVFDVFVKHWSDVEQLTRDYDVKITCNTPSVASIEGLVANVADCKEKLLQLVNKYVEEERQKKQLDYISNNVQWYYSQGGQSVQYDRELNGRIEMAHMENKGIFQFTKSGDRYEIDFIEMTEKNRRSGQVRKITRKRLGETGSDVSLPAEWDPQPPGQVVHLVSLSQSSSEYQRELNHFTSKGGTSRQIIKIERIQNPGLYKAYLAKKQSMNGEENEVQLFHGTKADNTHLINVNNFSRSFAGINGVKFGNGVYFARDASYSLGYAQCGSSNYRQMYVARVLVGRYTTGGAGMKAPPSRNDPANPGLLYDSVVNNIHNPSIFVIFLDHQCYPEYLMTFL